MSVSARESRYYGLPNSARCDAYGVESDKLLPSFAPSVDRRSKIDPFETPDGVDARTQLRKDRGKQRYLVRTIGRNHGHEGRSCKKDDPGQYKSSAPVTNIGAQGPSEDTETDEE